MKKSVYRFLCLGIMMIAAMNFVGCSDDDGPVGTLYFPRDVCMVDKPGGTASAEFMAVNIVSLSISEIPEGWTATADLQTSRVTVTAPGSDDSDAETVGVLTLVGYDIDGKIVSADLRVGIGPTVDLTGQTANCYIANHANAYYTFDRQGKWRKDSDGPGGTHVGKYIPYDRKSYVRRRSGFILRRGGR